MTRLLALFALVILTSACSGEGLSSLPTAPSAVTATGSTTVAAPATTQTIQVMGAPLSWQMADGCVVEKPSLSSIDVLRNTEPTNALRLATGELRAMWADPEKSSPKPVTSFNCEDFLKETRTVEYFLVAMFREQGGEWRYCSGGSVAKEQFITAFMNDEEIGDKCPN